MSGIGRQIAGGAAWMIFARVAERMLGLVSTLLLVRLLLPEDFGVVAMAMSVIAVVEIMGAFNFDMVLIYRQDSARTHYDTAWTFNVIVATTTAILLLVLAAPAAHFYGEPRLTLVIVLLALGSWLQGFENIGVVDFRKSLQFDREFRYLLAKKLIAFAVTVPLAFMLRNYWALVIGTAASKVGIVAASFVVHPYRPRFSLVARRDLFNFSKWLLFNNVILLARDRSADFTIGRLLGPHDLGLYSISNEIADLPTQQLTAPINRAVFPGYAKQAHDLSQLRATFLQVISIIWLVALPAGVGVAVTSDLLVPVVLGPNWMEAIPILGVLAVFGTLMVMQANIGYIFYALGTPRTTTLLTLAYVVVLLPLLIALTARNGAVGTAVAHLATAAVFVPVSLTVVFRRLELPVRAFVTVVWRTILAVAVMAIAVQAVLGSPVADALPAAAALALAVATGVLSYAAAIALLWLASGKPNGAESFLIDTVRPMLGRSGDPKLRQDGATAPTEGA